MGIAERRVFVRRRVQRLRHAGTAHDQLGRLDPPAWETLAPYIEKLVRSGNNDKPLRAWVPGCATGQEAYSLAILLRECMDRQERKLEVQVFGTDLDAGAIEIAWIGQ